MQKIQILVNKFFQYCQLEKNLSIKTIDCYRIDFNQFLSFLDSYGAEDDILKIDKHLITNYLQSLNVWKPKTVKRKMASLKAFINWLEFDEIISANPFRKIRVQIKDPFVLPAVMNSYEVETILRTAWECSDNVPSDAYKFRTVLRDIAVVELLFATGMRVSELCFLQKENIDLITGVIKINGKGSRERVLIVCNQEALNALISYSICFKEEIKNSEFFFINRLSQRLSDQSVRLLIKKLLKQSGLAKHITPHTFRHSFATLLLENNVDIKYIQNFLGHSSITTTQIYTHISTQKKMEILNIKHPREKFELRAKKD
jgi:integrase/recombinase XerD